MKLGTHFASMALALSFELAGWLVLPSPETGLFSALGTALVVVLTLLLTVIRYFLIRLDYDMRFYVLTDRSLRIRRGAMVIEESTYTFANVQNLSLRQNPIERLFDIANLHVDTAGGATGESTGDAGHSMYHRGKLEGVDPATARQLRHRLRELVASTRGPGVGHDHERHTAHPLTVGLGERHRQCLGQIVAELHALNTQSVHAPD